MWQKPIFDRTNADTLTARAGQSNIDNHKGALNYQDLNRIEGNFQHIIDQLYRNAFIVPYKKRCFEETIVRRVPRVKYRTVDFLESTGEQYFNSAVLPRQDTRVVLDIDVKAQTEQSTLFGARHGYQDTCFCVFTGDNNNGYQIDYGNTTVDSTGTVSSGRHTVDLNKNKFYVDGTLVYEYTYTAFQGSYEMFLLSVNNGGSAMLAYPVSAKLYSSQVYTSESLIRDLIPVLDHNNIPCLYDKIDDIFLYNAGVGSLTYGEILETVYSDTQTDLVTEKIFYTDWQESNIPWRSEIDRIRNNYNNLVRIFLHDIGLPILYSSQFLLYDEVNDWERIAFEGTRLVTNLEAEYIYCGTIDSGGDRLL